MGLIVFIILLILYFLPTVLAFKKNHQSKQSIFVLNIILGWTLLGWIIVFIWASTNPNNKTTKSTISSNVSDELLQLANLKRQGVLTNDEFSQMKQRLLDKGIV